MIFLLSLFGIKVDVITKDEAARELLAREVSFQWRPVIVEEGR